MLSSALSVDGNLQSVYEGCIGEQEVEEDAGHVKA
jgi:hypothetical protein